MISSNLGYFKILNKFFFYKHFNIHFKFYLFIYSLLKFKHFQLFINYNNKLQIIKKLWLKKTLKNSFIDSIYVNLTYLFTYRNYFLIQYQNSYRIIKKLHKLNYSFIVILNFFILKKIIYIYNFFYLNYLWLKNYTRIDTKFNKYLIYDSNLRLKSIFNLFYFNTFVL